jgi:hypothetical protein
LVVLPKFNTRGHNLKQLLKKALKGIPGFFNAKNKLFYSESNFSNFLAASESFQLKYLHLLRLHLILKRQLAFIKIVLHWQLFH